MKLNKKMEKYSRLPRTKGNDVSHIRKVNKKNYKKLLQQKIKKKMKENVYAK